MANNILWSPIDKNNFLTEFITSLNKKNLFKGNNYELLHKWSINNKKKFWSEVWNFTSIIGKNIQEQLTPEEVLKSLEILSNSTFKKKEVCLNAFSETINFDLLLDRYSLIL